MTVNKTQFKVGDLVKFRSEESTSNFMLVLDVSMHYSPDLYCELKYCELKYCVLKLYCFKDKLILRTNALWVTAPFSPLK